MGEIKALLITFIAGAIFLMAMVLTIGDFARDDTYNATLSTAADGNLTALYNNMTVVTQTAVNMKGILANSSVTTGDQQSNSVFGLGVPSIVGVGLGALNLLFAVPDYVMSFAKITTDLLPAPFSFLIYGIVSIVCVIIILKIAGTMLQNPDL